MIEYKGYIGAVDFDPEINLFHGTVINTNDVITFYGASVTELREEMQRSIEGYIEFCKEQGKVPEKPFSGEFSLQMSPETPDLKNTIAHILEHEQHLSNANEATLQQYMVLPILRALGWDDANLASMEVLPEYKVESKRADYALHIKREERPVVLIECKRWGQPIGKNEEQICFYAYSGNIPLAIITNGKLWRFYLSRWEAPSLSDRIFCETDIENREAAISDLEKYLLKSNVASGEAEVDAEIALEEKQGPDSSSESAPIHPKTNPVNAVINPKTIEPEATVDGEWTIDRVRNLVPQELKVHYESKYKKRWDAFYKAIAAAQNLIQAKGWILDVRFTKERCGFWLIDGGKNKKQLIFGVKITFSPPRFFAKITEEEVGSLSNQYECKMVSYYSRSQRAFYTIPEDLTELLPVLEFAYNKHRGN